MKTFFMNVKINECENNVKENITKISPNIYRMVLNGIVPK